ncbi:unnamed protein product [Allacma fusca]|uniref:Uncharacterized protein n=1 Tax=Allacma fusca TaxID=39272 RepID=A0A8J2JHD3_9HEXA|nr:unnamed protein product [Allacma fusca]
MSCSAFVHDEMLLCGLEEFENSPKLLRGIIILVSTKAFTPVLSSYSESCGFNPLAVCSEVMELSTFASFHMKRLAVLKQPSFLKPSFSFQFPSRQLPPDAEFNIPLSPAQTLTIFTAPRPIGSHTVNTCPNGYVLQSDLRSIPSLLKSVPSHNTTVLSKNIFCHKVRASPP